MRGLEDTFTGVGALIQFDLSEIPPGSEIVEARLFLYHYSVSGRADLDPPDAQELDGVGSDVAEAVRSV